MRLSFTFWHYRVLALVLLAPLFFMIYGYANNYTSTINNLFITEIVYSWEKYIPFIPSTILPYWSIDLFYGISLFLPMTFLAFRQHFLRLLVATPLAALFFINFPLQFSTPKPEIDSIWNVFFVSLSEFDKPYNQAPSLHIILLVIIWQGFLPFLNNIRRFFWNFWCFLIGISVLTTFQHHFIDVPTGFLVGVFICYLFPLEKEIQWKISRPKSISIGAKYFLISLTVITFSIFVNFIFQIVLWWIAFSFLTVSFGYIALDESVFQKKANGKLSFAAYIVLFPFRFFTKLTREFFFKTKNKEIQVYENLYIGDYNSSKTSSCECIFDVCVEYEKAHKKSNYINFPILDLVPIKLTTLKQGVLVLDDLLNENKVLVHCALGMSRSTTIVIAWLGYKNVVTTVEDAIELIESKNYTIHLSKKHMTLLNNYFNQK